MDVSGILAVFDGISVATLAIGGSAIALTLSLAGLCTMFAWLDMHIGGFIKKVFTSVMAGGAMMAGGGGFGHWIAITLGVAAMGPPPPTP